MASGSAHVLETHNHADHVSGKGRLQKATGAVIHVPARGRSRFRAQANGRRRCCRRRRRPASKTLATPGHRPEHTAYVISDAAAGRSPGSSSPATRCSSATSRSPDLAVEPEEGARELFASLNRLLELDDFAEAWPGHIGGSLCGGAGMSEKPGTTIGFERRFNRLLRLGSEQAFVRELTGHLSPQPPNFKRIVELNKGSLLTEASVLEPLAPARVKEMADAGVLLLDGRPTRDFDAEHVPGSVNVTMTRSSVGTRAAWIADPEAGVLLNAAREGEARRMARLLEAVGFRKIAGFLSGGTTAWREAGFETGSTIAVDVPGLAEQIRSGEVRVLDVRDEDEWEESHVPGSIHIPFHELRDGVPAELENGGKPLAIVCSAGNRSSIAASLLKRAGLDGVEHVAGGGVEDLRNEGIELVEGE